MVGWLNLWSRVWHIISHWDTMCQTRDQEKTITVLTETKNRRTWEIHNEAKDHVGEKRIMKIKILNTLDKPNI